MALYECTFITRADLSKPDVAKVTEQFSTIVTEAGGKIVKEEYWGLRPLAYPINKSSKGHYIFLGVDANATAIDEIIRQAGISENVVRNLNIRVDAIDEAPSSPMNRDEDRGGRYDRNDRNNSRGGRPERSDRPDRSEKTNETAA